MEELEKGTGRRWGIPSDLLGPGAGFHAPRSIRSMSGNRNGSKISLAPNSRVLISQDLALIVLFQCRSSGTPCGSTTM